MYMKEENIFINEQIKKEMCKTSDYFCMEELIKLNIEKTKVGKIKK